MPWIIAAFWGIAAIICGASGCGGGTAASEATADEPTRYAEVIFSVANKDPRAAVSQIDVMADGVPVVHGSFAFMPEEEYLYFATSMPWREARIEAVSEVDGEVLTASKVAAIKDHTWIVITQAPDLDGEPELIIEVSYEVRWPE